MGRRLSTSTVSRAEAVYRFLIEAGGAVTTKLLFEKLRGRGIRMEYMELYRALRLLEKKGLVTAEAKGKETMWTLLKHVDERELRIVLSSRG